MAKTVGDFFWDRVGQWGISRVFGYAGDGINELVAALHRREDRFEFVQARHEELAAFMAAGHAKLTGEVGVCLATSGPGAIHLLNGLYDAKLDHAPVVAVVGQQARMALGGHYQQEVALETLFADVSGFCQRADSPAQVRHLVDRAFRIALSERTIATIILPKDLQEEPAVETPPRAHGSVHSGVGYTRPRVVPKEDDLRAAADIINAGQRVAILVGQGARDAKAEVIELAEKTGAGVAKALVGRDVLPDTLPFVTGSIGLLGTRPSYDMMEGCDTLVMIGSGFPYSEWLPEEGKARGVQIDINPAMLGLRYPMEAPLCGDAADTLRALLPLITTKTDRSWRHGIEQGIERWWQTLDEKAMVEADPVNPQRVFRELSPRLPDGVVLTADSGTATDWFARDLRLRDGMRATLSGGLATMGPAVPYAIAAKYAWPDRPVIACVGDGAMQMNGINGLITIAATWKRWRDPRLLVLVLNNRDLAQVTWEMRAQDGVPKFPASQTLPDFPYARYAELVGLKGYFIDRPEQIGETLDAALAHPGPTVVEVRTDPNVPPLPPHIRPQNARAFLASLWSGDPEAGSMLRQSIRDMIVDLLPGRRK